MNYKVSHPDAILKGSIHLSGSKSESNRLLILKEVLGLNIDLVNLSDSNDTSILSEILMSFKKNSRLEFNVGDAGTAMRFLTAFFAIQNGVFMLTGSERMKERPIKDLVEALRNLGAEIEYLQEEGFPPLRINGKKLKGGKIEMNATVSSQFSTALLLIAPLFEDGLVIRLKGEPVSFSYLQMTIQLLRQFGVDIHFDGNEIYVSPLSKSVVEYPKSWMIESDWSSASYWFEMAALSREADLTIFGLKENSLQGDSICMEIFERLGLNCFFEENCLRIQKSEYSVFPDKFAFHFSSCPDLVQTMAITCAALKIESQFSGIMNLHIKETDRMYSLQNELIKVGVRIEKKSDTEYLIPSCQLTINECVFETYGDHRMAMCFAPLALVSNGIELKNTEVVEKSYTNFWNDLRKLGFCIDEL